MLFVLALTAVAGALHPAATRAESSGAPPSTRPAPSEGATPPTAQTRSGSDTPDRASAPDAATGQTHLVVNLPAYRLTIYQGDEAVASYPIAIGAPNRRVGQVTVRAETPTGPYTVGKKTKNPAWYPPALVIREEGLPADYRVAPGPRNPLGVRWIGLARPGYLGYGIHGTSTPSSIGHAVSLGCMRMHNADVVKVFNAVDPGDAVDVVYRTVELVRGGDGRPLLVVHPDVYGRGTPTVAEVRAALRQAGFDGAIGSDAFWAGALGKARDKDVFVALSPDHASPAVGPRGSRSAAAGESRAASLASAAARFATLPPALAAHPTVLTPAPAHPETIHVSLVRAPLGTAVRTRDGDYLLAVADLPSDLQSRFAVVQGVVRFYDKPLAGAILKGGHPYVPLLAVARVLRLHVRWLDPAHLDLSW